MNAKKLIAAVAMIAATGSVFASEVLDGVYPAMKFTPTKTRAEVVAELNAAKADGSYALGHQEYAGQDLIAASQYAKARGQETTAVARNGNAVRAN